MFLSLDKDIYELCKIYYIKPFSRDSNLHVPQNIIARSYKAHGLDDSRKNTLYMAEPIILVEGIWSKQMRLQAVIRTRLRASLSVLIRVFPRARVGDALRRKREGITGLRRW